MILPLPITRGPSKGSLGNDSTKWPSSLHQKRKIKRPFFFCFRLDLKHVDNSGSNLAGDKYVLHYFKKKQSKQRSDKYSHHIPSSGVRFTHTALPSLGSVQISQLDQCKKQMGEV